MSEFAFFLAPSEPYCFPTEEKQKEFLELFKTASPLPNANGDYYFYVYDQPEMIDPGAGFEAVICPACNADNPVCADHDDDSDTPFNDWWEAALAGPRDAMVNLPCCGAPARLADLRFSDVGCFARFAVGALEPGFSEHWQDGGDNFGHLTDETLQRFADIIGCPVIEIWSVQ